MIYVTTITADKLREELAHYKPSQIISIVISRYKDGWAFAYQIIHKDV